ncbi:MAG: RnfABCDGE type electron transport complex subunit D [Pseudomonadales bacterium]|nr:RnfABCDGE type electron transport complex subunit D [Pseudomonadales bacterium]
MATLTPRAIMLRVLAALVPGFVVASHFYGPGYLANLVIALAAAALVEAGAARARGVPVAPVLRDGSALVTAALLALALPPGTPWHVVALAIAAGLGLGKHLYGGLGNNPFNPAVVGYAVVLVSFPGALATWPAAIDGLSGATALTTFKYREGQTVADVWTAANGFGALGGHPEQWLNLAFLAGGLALARMRLLAWRIPAALLGTLGVLALAGYDQGSSSSLGSPLFHWFSGGTMLAAWFFATDPVTHPASARGQLLFGCLIGIIAFSIRSFGAYPDGLAFAILLANGCSAWLDRPARVRLHG